MPGHNLFLRGIFNLKDFSKLLIRNDKKHGVRNVLLVRVKYYTKQHN